MCHVEVAANGCSYRASGAVQGGVPVLLELCGSVFRQPVSLAGSLLFFKAHTNPQLLSSVAGKNVTQSFTGFKGKTNTGAERFCLRVKIPWINLTYLSHHR